MEQTVGQASYDLLKKSDEKINVIDMQREMQKSVLQEIDEIIKNHTRYSEKYYILYLLQRDRIMPNVIRQKFIVRKTRPKPDYDSSLFSYNNKTSQLAFHWSIPDEDTCMYLLANKNALSSDEQALLSYVEKFSSGVLE